ncbi:MAG: hypothetical protein ACREOI_15040 [bacterium]
MKKNFIPDDSFQSKHSAQSKKYSSMTGMAVHQSEELLNQPLKISILPENVKGFFCLVTPLSVNISTMENQGSSPVVSE